MRLSSISFTHASTATFGLAVACYAAVRLAGYDVPHLPGHLALPAPRIIQQVPDTRQPTSRSAQQATGFVDDKTRHPTIGDELRTDVAAVIPNAVARQLETAVVSLEWSRPAQEWPEDSSSGEETHSEQTDTAPGDEATDAPAPSTSSDDTEDSVDPAPATTPDEEETTASSPDITDSDDEPADR